MRMSKLVGKTVRETPRDAELVSHQFMLRAGYMRQYSAGIYGLLPLGMRSITKIEQIIREEMNVIDGQEVKMPCMTTRELWEESGRYQNIDSAMFRLKDRNKKDMVLCMTHEEPVVAYARTEISSYRQLPVMMYQVQTKYRDEARPRAGLIRCREFLMKDAYSFHTSEEDLNTYYNLVHKAYEKIFYRVGCKNYVSVMSDNGMFGGKFSHEFMLLVPGGEDTIITCSSCKYKANREVATSSYALKKQENLLTLEKVHTPSKKSIAEVAEFLKVAPEDTCKAVMFETVEDAPQKKPTLVIAFVRGDLEAMDLKVAKLVRKPLVVASPETIEASEAVAGSVGPLSLNWDKVLAVFDLTVTQSSSLVIGSNEEDYHCINFNYERDFVSQIKESFASKVFVGDIAAVREGDPCPDCGKALCETRGIEIGNIFHLGTKYTESMNCTYLDAQGKSHYPIMGCYGIGVTRLLPSIIEESHDKYGMILPISIAPYHVHFNVLNMKEEGVRQASEELYQALTKAGIEVLIDDRDEKPGSQFADADLIGIPLRIILSPKTLATGSVEFKYRDNRDKAILVPLQEMVPFLQKAIQDEFKKYDAHALNL